MRFKWALFYLFVFVVAFVGNAQEPRLVLPVGHTYAVESAKFSPCGKFVLSISLDRSLKIWDVTSGKMLKEFADYRRDNGAKTDEISTHFSSNGKYLIFARNWERTANVLDLVSGKIILKLEGHTRNILSVQFSPNGEYAATASADDTVKIWEITSGKNIQQLVGHTFGVHTIKFSPDGKQIITASYDRSIRIWETSTGKLTWNRASYSECKAVQFSPSGKLISVVTSTNSILFYNADNGKLINEMNFGHKLNFQNNAINSVKFSPDGKSIVMASNNDTVSVWDVYSGKLLQNLIGHSSYVKSAQFSPDGRSIITASGDNTAKVWDLEKGEMIVNLSQHRSNVNFAEFSPDGRSVLTVSDDATLKIWDAASGELMHNLMGYAESIIDTKISHDSKRIINASWEDDVKIWDAATGRTIQNLIGHSDYVKSVEFSSNGQYVITVSGDRTAKVWNSKSGELIWDLYDSTNYVRLAKFSPDGKSFGVALLDNSINIWEVESGELFFHVRAHLMKINDIQFSPDGKRIVSVSDDKTAKIFDVSTGKLLHHLTGHFDEVLSAQFSNNAKRIVTTSGGGDIKIWDAEKGELIHNIEGHNGRVTSAHFSSDGKKIVSSSRGKTSKIWDAESGLLVHNLKSHFDIVYAAFFSPDDTKVLTYSADGTAKLWDVRTGEMISDLLGHHDFITSSSFFNNGRYIITTGFDRKTIIWDTPSGDQIYTRIQLKDNNHIITIPNSKYYMCTKDASKMMHYVTDDLKVIGFEQLDPVYNRPDKVMEHISKYMEVVDHGMIDNYRKAWEKRVERLGLDIEKLGSGVLEVPEAEIINIDDLAYYNTNGTVRLHLKATDKKHHLLRYNVIVNEVPLFGSLGVNISNRKIMDFDTTLTVKLNDGQNKIQVSTMNALGLENFKYPAFVNYTPEVENDSRTIFIGIAVDSFVQYNYNLTYCVKDIKDLSQLFENEKNTEVMLLTNSEVNRENVLAIKQRLLETSINDRVIISCSSHGLLNEENQFYLAMHDMDFQNASSKGLAFSELESLLDSIPARKKLLLLDACNSGLTDAPIATKQDLAYTKKNNPQSRGAGVSNATAKTANNEFQTMLELFVNVENLSGVIVISAAGGSESALEGVRIEGKKIENGVFTYAILECILQNVENKLSVNTLKKYVENRVEELTEGLQKPTSRQESMEIDWYLFQEAK
jgi:WD40 repeat protein